MRLCPIPQHLMHIKLGPASLYLSTISTSFPNQRPDTQSFLALASLLTVIKMGDPHFPTFYRSLRQLSLISQKEKAFSYILVENSTFRFNNSILSSLKYLSSNISCTLKRCQCSSISTSITVGLIVFAAQISRFDSQGINTSALAFSIRSADLIPDSEIFT